jgi:hypothetical protein
MEPERAGVLGRELVGEALARLDRRLRGVRDAVHVVGHAHAVPVDGRRLRQLIREVHAQRLTEPDAQRWTGDLPVVGPDAHARAIHERKLRLLRRDLESPHRAASCSRRRIGALELTREPRLGRRRCTAGEDQERAGNHEPREAEHPVLVL